MNIFVVPDLHCDPHYSNDRCSWVGKYAAKHGRKGDVVVQLGDFGEFRSFSTYESSAKGILADNYEDDFKAVEDGWNRLTKPLKRKGIRVVVTEGNHEYRIRKALIQNPKLEGSISMDRLPWRGSSDCRRFASYRQSVSIGGIDFTHCVLTANGRAVSSKHDLGKAVFSEWGRSIVVGHSHIWSHHQRCTGDHMEFGLSAGHMSHPLHPHEDWVLGASRNWWAGITVLEGVSLGHYEGLHKVSFGHLEKNYR